MGMFDYVNYQANCQKCGEPLEGFQTKDTACELVTVEPSKCDHFYTSCDKCGTWHDFHVERECVVKGISVSVGKY